MGLPVITGAVVLPNRFHIGDTISVSYTFTADPGKSDHTTIIRWYKNSKYQPVYDNKRSFTVTGIRGDIWFFQIVPFDGTQYGASKTSDTGIMLNNLPSPASYVEVVPHNPTVGLDDLKVFCSGSVDPDHIRHIIARRIADKQARRRKDSSQGTLF